MSYVHMNMNVQQSYMNHGILPGGCFPTPFPQLPQIPSWPDPFGFQPFPNFNDFHQNFAQGFMMGLFQALAPRINPTPHLSGQVGFGQFGSGSRVDDLVRRHGNDIESLSRELSDHNWGNKDEKRLEATINHLRNTSGPRATVGGSAGVGNSKITVPPEVANRMARASSDQEATQIFRGWLNEQAGSSDPRAILNEVFDSNIKGGKEKDATAELMLDTIVEQSVKTVRSGRMLDWSGQPTCCVPCYHCPVQLDFCDPDYMKAINKTADLASPLSLDFDGDGKFISDEKVQFDIDGDGSLDTVNDVDEGDLLLRFDADGDGVSGENGTELLGDNADLSRFGVHGQYKDGFEALYALASRFGLVGGSDTTLSARDLSVLEQQTGLQVSAGGLNGQSVSFAEKGLNSIELGNAATTRTTHDFDGRGNALTTRQGAGFTTVDGGWGSMADIWFRMHN
jgi:hypothetical protein